MVLYKKGLFITFYYSKNTKYTSDNAFAKSKVRIGEEKEMIILLAIYMIAGYWATGKTIYANRILIGTWTNIFMRRVIMGTLLGVVLIPWAILKR